MGIASLILGICSAIAAFMPFCGFFTFTPATIGFILGVVDLVIKHKNNQPKGVSIAGVVLNVVAIVVAIGWFVLIGVGVAASQESIQHLQ